MPTGKGGGGCGTNYRSSGPDYVAYVFVFLGSICPSYKPNLSGHDQVNLQLTFDVSVTVRL